MLSFSILLVASIASHYFTCFNIPIPLFYSARNKRLPQLDAIYNMEGRGGGCFLSLCAAHKRKIMVGWLAIAVGCQIFPFFLGEMIQKFIQWSS